MIIEEKYNLKRIIKEGAGTLIGAAIMALGTSLFLLPNQLSTGGVAGIATIIYYFIKIPMGTTILAFNIPLFIMAVYRLGKNFFTKSLVGTISFSIFIDIFDKLKPLTNDRLLACIYGGIIIGFGTAIILKSNSSTGGSDLLSFIARSYKPNLRTSNIIIIIDTVIVFLNMLFFKEIEIGLYSAIAIYIMGKVIDVVFEGVNFTKMIFIISDKYLEISEKIVEHVGRGITGIHAKGMYTNDEKMMLWCIASRNEAMRIKQISKKIDPRSFVVISNAREAYGVGFKRE